MFVARYLYTYRSLVTFFGFFIALSLSFFNVRALAPRSLLPLWFTFIVTFYLLFYRSLCSPLFSYSYLRYLLAFLFFAFLFSVRSLAFSRSLIFLIFLYRSYSLATLALLSSSFWFYLLFYHYYSLVAHNNLFSFVSFRSLYLFPFIPRFSKFVARFNFSYRS